MLNNIELAQTLTVLRMQHWAYRLQNWGPNIIPVRVSQPDFETSSSQQYVQRCEY
jgi:hypothetical protein